MFEFTPSGPHGSVPPEWRTLFQRAEELARWSAEVAEAVASNLEDLAATYRRMANGVRPQYTAERLLEHVARLELRAVHERAAAVRFREMVDRPR